MFWTYTPKPQNPKTPKPQESYNRIEILAYISKLTQFSLSVCLTQLFTPTQIEIHAGILLTIRL